MNLRKASLAGNDANDAHDPLVHLMARREIYASISFAMADPVARDKEVRTGRWPDMLNCAIAFVGEDAAFHPADLGPGEIDPASAGPAFPLGLAEAIAKEYPAVFGYCTSKNCPPYETEYCALKDVHYRTQKMADVAGFYRAFGLQPSPAVHDRLDHIALETEFMAVLIARELFALQQKLGTDAVEVCRQAQRQFFRDHLVWWLPRFGRTLMDQSSETYRLFGTLICLFVPAERAILGLPPVPRLPSPEIDPPEEMTCDQTCGNSVDTELPPPARMREIHST